ncbi:MAG: RNA methyltransferase, partial [Eubacteriales bacterium]|nr:RNA methyltransferase [Eubacteriales bacterium]
VNTDRTIVKLSGKEDKKVARWNKISESAAKQSRRGKIPIIENIISFEQAIENCKENNLNIIPYEKEEENTIKNIIKDFKGEKIGIFIGPEGGFSEKEIEIATKNNILPITLGKRILRTETAGMVATTILLYELEE